MNEKCWKCGKVMVDTIIREEPEKNFKQYITQCPDHPETLEQTIIYCPYIPSNLSLPSATKNDFTDIDWSKYPSTMPSEGAIYPKGQDKVEIIARLKSAFHKFMRIMD